MRQPAARSWTLAWSARVGEVGVVGAHAAGDAQFEVRAVFQGNNGLCRDPADRQPERRRRAVVDSGRFRQPAMWPVRAQRPRSSAAVCKCMRDEAGQVRVGGESVTCIGGTVLV
jgi:hypothetical protein